MKKYFLPLIFAILLAPAARPWRLLAVDDTSDKELFALSRIVKSYKETGKGFAAYCVNAKVGGDKSIFSRDAAQALNAWIQNTITHINKSGRQKEFDDIIKVLSSAGFKEIDCCAQTVGFTCEVPDIQFNFSGTPASYFRLSKPYSEGGGNYKTQATIYLNANSYKGEPILHETGHFYRAADMYTDDNMEPGIGTGDSLNSIMNDVANNPNQLTCDDAEAVINIYDCFSQDNPFRRGGDKGWKSICPGRNIIYKNCIAEVTEDSKKALANERRNEVKSGLAQFSGDNNFGDNNEKNKRT